MKRDPLLWGALVAVLVVLASAEYELARACGFGKYVAAGVPAALDIYAIKALRSKRDVPLAVIALIAVNAASHLVASGLLPVDWPLIVAVSAIAPLVLWRVHRLSEEPSVAQTATEVEASRVEFDTTSERRSDPVVTSHRLEVVPTGVDLLPIVSVRDTTEMTIERVDTRPEQVVTRPAIETGWKPLEWPIAATSGRLRPETAVTVSVPAADLRQVVTVPVTITPAELRKQARKLNREAVSDTGRPVTIAALMDGLNLSRRDATDLRRHVVDGSRS
ncbi:hypothetical protein [Streptomyces sp. NBC_01506]|uniref:hypothetical protein n=1 Tax=Streptomyces sp. NBC_01506 TaxID=2903887 RepID=UPI00386B74FB